MEIKRRTLACLAAMLLISTFLASCSLPGTDGPSTLNSEQLTAAPTTLSLTATIAPPPLPTGTATPTPTAIPVPESSYEASRTSICLERDVPLAVGYADFNRDGREDILTAYVSGTTGTTPIRMMLQHSDGVLRVDDSLLPAEGAETVHARKIVIADFNGDSVPDVFIADHGFDQPPFPGARSMLLVSKDERLEVRPIENVPFGFQHSATAADITGDGAPEIFVADSSNGAFLLINDGAGNFTFTRQGFPSIRAGYYTSEFIDFDADGYYDLLVGGHEQDGAVTRVFWGDSTGTFSTARSSAIPSDPDYRIVLDFDAGDLDGDGEPELILTRTMSNPFYQGYYFQILEMSDRVFSDVSNRIVTDRNDWEGAFAWWVPWIVIRDINGDGYLDLVDPQEGCSLAFLNDGHGFLARHP